MAESRLEAASSGPNTRKFVMFPRMTSRPVILYLIDRHRLLRLAEKKGLMDGKGFWLFSRFYMIMCEKPNPIDPGSIEKQVIRVPRFHPVNPK
jgi:hypothetical protein